MPKAILIDDEKEAIQLLTNQLSKYCPSIEIIGTEPLSDEKVAVPCLYESKETKVFPSDHFGLCAKLKLKES